MYCTQLTMLISYIFINKTTKIKSIYGVAAIILAN